jgi:hypothetical protein
MPAATVYRRLADSTRPIWKFARWRRDSGGTKGLFETFSLIAQAPNMSALDLAAALNNIIDYSGDVEGRHKHIVAQLETLKTGQRRLATLYLALAELHGIYQGKYRVPPAAALLASYAENTIRLSDSNDFYNQIALRLVRYVEANHAATPRPLLLYSLGRIYRNQLAAPLDERKAFAYVVQGARQDGTLCKRDLARCYLNGWGVAPDPAKAVTLFEQLAHAGGGTRDLLECMALGHCNAPAGMTFGQGYEQLAADYAAYRVPYLIRLLAGIGMPSNISAAEKFLRRFPSELGTHLFKMLSQPAFQRFCSSGYAKKLVQNYETRNVPTNHIPWRLRLVGRSQFAYLVAALRYLAVVEEHVHERSWHELNARAAAVYLGISYRKAIGAALDVGPRFNALSPAGIPCANWPPSGQHVSMPDTDSLLILSRQGIILALLPRLRAHRKTYGHRLIGLRDVFALLALAFGDCNRAVMPQFSLDDYVSDPNEFTLFRYSKKVFQPTFLAATPIGKSLYASDKMMPTFGRENLFSHTSYFDNAYLEGELHNSDFYSEIECAPGRMPDANSQSITLAHVDAQKISVMRALGFELTKYVIRHAEMRFNARTFRVVADGLEQTLSRNDVGNRNGLRAAIGSRRFEEIARAFPVFARVRIFLAMSKLLATLRGDQRYQLARPVDWFVKRAKDMWQMAAVEDQPIPRHFAGKRPRHRSP